MDPEAQKEPSLKMAIAAPPSISKRHRDDQHLVDMLIMLQGQVNSLNAIQKKVARAGLALLVTFTGAANVARAHAAIMGPSQYAAHPEAKTVDPKAAIASAFERAITRDASEYAAIRESIVTRADAPDPVPTSEQEIFPGLAAYRKAMGV